jgi:hypothetical protein
VVECLVVVGDFSVQLALRESRSLSARAALTQAVVGPLEEEEEEEGLQGVFKRLRRNGHQLEKRCCEQLWVLWVFWSLGWPQYMSSTPGQLSRLLKPSKLTMAVIAAEAKGLSVIMFGVPHTSLPH